ncbi:amidohydrolase family protein [Shewanella corallii]|uniref:Amidohydrolase family protein n=1 Tax=Shewanella corallii TaxID=560080 RepID=A0ABT0N2Y4_9GAMM|nr:amidohydrolase family protein [Shewanella corallii]MCL2912801.1 amidohydrolase family protein [Shewanella corallii]
MNIKKWILRIFIGGSLLTLIWAVSSYFFVDYQLDKMYGGHTELAEIPELDFSHSRYAVTNSHIWGSDAHHFQSGLAVIIDDGEIADIVPEDSLSADITVVDGQGGYLVPGFTDSHVHLWQSKNDLLLYLANGVTQVREMNGSEQHIRWRDEIEAGALGPNIYVVSPQLATFGPVEGWFVGWTQNKTIVSSAEEVETAVKDFKQQGYDAVKASSFLDKAGYQALSDATQQHQIPMVGHIPIAVRLDDFIASSQSETAHVEELVKALAREYGGFKPENKEAFLTWLRGRSPQVAEQLLERNKSVTTTLAIIDSFHPQKSDLASELKRVELKYVNPGIAEGVIITSQGMGWLPDVNIYRLYEGMTPERREEVLEYWQAYAEAQYIMFDELRKKGVHIQAGTDTNVPVIVPGFSLHEEMLAMQEAGMKPTEVLRDATLSPGNWMQQNVGQISPGYQANLVLLRDNPGEDIRATQSIESVIIGGKLLSREYLDKLLASVLTANDNSRTVDLEDQGWQ